MAKTKSVSPARMVRLRKMEQMYLRGVTSVSQVAAAFNVSIATASSDLKWIMEHWRSNSPGGIDTKRLQRVRQLENMMHLAMVEFDYSRQERTETVTVLRKNVCVVCRGTGVRFIKEEEVDCPGCDGMKWQMEQVTTEKKMRSGGDMSCLNTARACLADISKLEGLPVKKIEETRQINVALHESLLPSKTDSKNPLMNAPVELLVDLAKASAKLQESVIEGKVVEKKNGSGKKNSGA